MKKTISIISILFLFICCAFPAFATVIPTERQVPLVVDEAQILSAAEETELLAKLNEISARQKCDIGVATVNSLNGKSAQLFVNDYYDIYGYGYGNNDDGILLLLSMEERDWAIRTFGSAVTIFTDAGQEYITERIIPDLSDGNYAEAFTAYADLCDEFITHYNTNSTAYDVSNLPKEPMTATSVIIALFIGIIVAFIVTASMKSKLKSVTHKQNASSYIRDGSFVVSDSRDIFITRKVTRVPIPKPTNSSRGSGGGSSRHSSSSGRIGGGSSGKF